MCKCLTRHFLRCLNSDYVVNAVEATELTFGRNSRNILAHTRSSLSLNYMQCKQRSPGAVPRWAAVLTRRQTRILGCGSE